MASINIQVLDQTSGRPIADAAVIITIPAVNATVTSGFTTSSGTYLAQVYRQFIVVTYTITINAKGYEPFTGTKTVSIDGLVSYSAQLTPLPIALPNPLTYPVVVGVGTAPDLLVTPPAAAGFDEVIVRVEGAFPSSSRSPIPETGTVVVPLATRLLVAPPTALVLIGHQERLRQASEMRQVYTIVVSGRTGNRLVQLGTLVTTAILVEIDELATRLTTSPWLTPWPGVIPVERYGYTELMLALPRSATAGTYLLYQSGHDTIDGPLLAQDTYSFVLAPGGSSYQPYRLRVPDYSARYVRLFLTSPLGNLPPVWLQYRLL